jgi:uncharacterized Fe-S cluster-containing radical SAM superfamily enzyme
MNIQSLSIVVPTKNKCINNCKFCVSRTHTNPYIDNVSKCLSKRGKFDVMIDTDSIEYKDYFNRLQFARDNGCNVVILTGTGEPTQNFNFLKFFSVTNSKLVTPFKNIEIQSTGVLLDENSLEFLRNEGVTTISLSISNIFDNERNLEIIECHEKLKFELEEIISLIKKYDFNLRLSLNLISDYDDYTVEQVLNKCHSLGADQVTFRKLYMSKSNSKIDKWIKDNDSLDFYSEIDKYIKTNGTYLGKLPFGAVMYDINEMSVVIDDDCMNEEIKDVYKYLILRENGRLYSRWEIKSSLLF